MATLLLIVFLFLLTSGFSVIGMTIRNGISPMPTSPKVKKQLFEILPKKTEKNVLELGSGWGTLAFPLARHYPSNQVIAYENSLIPYLFCLFWHRLFPYKNLRFIYQDFHKASFENASLAICYLYPGAMNQLQLKFDNELDEGSLIATHTFAIPSWKPIQIEYVNDLYHTPIYLYKKAPR